MNEWFTPNLILWWILWQKTKTFISDRGLLINQRKKNGETHKRKKGFAQLKVTRCPFLCCGLLARRPTGLQPAMLFLHHEKWKCGAFRKKGCYSLLPAYFNSCHTTTSLRPVWTCPTIYFTNRYINFSVVKTFIHQNRVNSPNSETCQCIDKVFINNLSKWRGEGWTGTPKSSPPLGSCKPADSHIYTCYGDL